MARITMVEALNQALLQEMGRDERVIVLGEDVGRNGGVFRVTDGLFKKFGGERVIDTPLAESAIIGSAIGLAVAGFRPVAEIQFSGFLPAGFDQLISHASRMRHRSRSGYTVPMVVRCPYGGGVHALEHHSESFEAAYAHICGLKVVMPSRPFDAKGLLTEAIRDPDPVLFMEPKKVYRSIKEEVPEEEFTVPLGEANIVREGADATVVAWGSMVKTCLEAAEQSDADLEVVDLRTIKPFDRRLILQSVKKTRRLVVAHEATKTGGWGAEIAASVAESPVSRLLKAPMVRVASPDVVVPLPQYEKYFFPDIEQVLHAVGRVMSGGEQ